MDIKEIKKLKGYQIAYNENYICYMGSRLVVHDRHGNQVCTFSDMRNYGWVDLFKGHYLVARNGGCTFKVYDLQQKMCVKTYQVLGRKKRLRLKNCLLECGDGGMPVYRFSV